MGVLSTANVLRGLLPWRCLLLLYFMSHHAVHPKQNMICHLATCQNRRCGRCVTSHKVGVDQLVDIKYLRRMCLAVGLAKLLLEKWSLAVRQAVKPCQKITMTLIWYRPPFIT
jgi:hypothetical protein